MHHSEDASWAVPNSPQLPLRSSAPLAAVNEETPGDSFAEDDAVVFRSAAVQELARWTPAARANAEGRRTLQAGWRKAARSFHRAEQWVRHHAAKGRTLPPGIYTLAEHAPRVRLALRETRDALKRETPPPLPLVQNGESCIVPRIYALVRGFLDASHFVLTESDLTVYLAAAQDQQPLELNELWALKPMLQLVIVQEIGAALDALCGNAERVQAHPASSSGTLSTLLTTLQTIAHTDWVWIFEQASHTEKTLQQDPSGVYPQMDPDSRDTYREVVREVGAHCAIPEIEIARTAVHLARQVPALPGEDPRLAERRKHVGYYLVDEGRRYLEARVHYRPPFHRKIERAILRWPEVPYVVGIEMVTVGIIAFLLSGLRMVVPPFSALALLVLPATESAVRIMNRLISFLIRPRRLPKLDFTCGIPPECATMIVVPTLLLSERQVRKTVGDLEIRYLANSDANLHLALLTDSPDSAHPLDEGSELVELCVRLIQNLNEKYRPQHQGSFFLFHRHRIYNPVEGAWMGWERKRGKLLDLNRLLRNDFDSFPVKVGDLSILPSIRYVITLDSDTQLPRGAGKELVGTLAHPLNRAVIDRQSNIVTKGYGILQPRVGISISSATRSRLASFYSGQTGFDLYTRATSDVYQDLFDEGSFTGKGIYEVDVYQQVLAQRFPANALLSHDLIEGSYARAGLVSDIEVIDDYPSHFSAYSRRKHRWVRGDWQILRWLMARVPGYFGKPVPNPLSFISRWKILDNLRRSLIEAATLALLVAGWFFLAGGALYWTVATLILVVLPSYLQLFLSLAMATESENKRGALKEAVKGFVDEQVTVLFAFVFLLHQALVTLDAIIRTLVRLVVTHKKLLEWETAAEAELGSQKRSPVEMCLDLTVSVSIALVAGLAYLHPRALPEALPFLVAWACSKPIRQWLDRPLPPEGDRISRADESLLRTTALYTWRFFREWGGASVPALRSGQASPAMAAETAGRPAQTRAYGLIPDNIQESPFLVANVVSPTNLGFLLAARLAALDLGYLTAGEFVQETGITLATAQRLPRFKGHFYNWNHTETLEPLPPLFVSTVDSGNLAACLWTLKQGCIHLEHKPLFHTALWQAVRDHLVALRNLAGDAKRSATAPVLEELHRRFEQLGDEPTSWMISLSELETKVAGLEKSLADEDGGPGREERLWWASELRARVAAIRVMADKFTPWLLPEYRSHFLYPNTQPLIETSRITLAALPPVMTGLITRLQDLVNHPTTELKVRSEVRVTLGIVQTSLENIHALLASLRQLADVSDALVADMDFRFLYNPARRVLSIGYNATAQRVEKACYDFLASEARTASFMAIAKGDIPQKSWFQLGRRHTIFQGQRTLISWSGTMFEYLMPALWMESYGDTILGQSQVAVVRCQQRVAWKRRRPWGISEAGCARRDAEGRYQYQAFGVQPLAFRPDVTSDVVAPYATFLALQVDPQESVRNLKRMKRMGWFGTYGYYESADYNPPQRPKGSKYELVRSWMAHHQGMILLALCNQLAGSSIQRRFHAEPRVQATELVLHEHVPDAVPVAPPEVPLLPGTTFQPDGATR
jgi:cyclic beta-1,2-glucan synthetase